MGHFWIRKSKIFLIETQIQIPLLYKSEYPYFRRILKSDQMNGRYHGGVLSNHRHPLSICIATPILLLVVVTIIIIINPITMLEHMDIIPLPLLPLLGTITTIITNTIMETTIPNKYFSYKEKVNHII